MLKNYLKITVRNLIRQKGYTFINVSGLAVGMACCLLIFLYVQFELSYDSFHEDADSIYRIRRFSYSSDSSSQPFPVAPALKDAHPDIDFVRFFKLFQHVPAISYENKVFFEQRFMFADGNVFDVFSFPLLAGDPQTALTAPNTVVLTEDMAEKYFGNENAMGKRLSLNGKVDYVVTGILKNIPKNTHFAFDFLATLEGIDKTFALTGTPVRWYESWYWNPCWTYARLPEGYTVERFQNELDVFSGQYFKERIETDGHQYYLQNIRSIHLDSDLYNEMQPNSDASIVYVFLVIAVFILLIACVNFMNLSSARSLERSKEVGIRKVLGAYKSQLVKQFLGESIVMSLAAIILALVIVEMFTPYFNNITGMQLTANYQAHWKFAAGALLFAIFVGSLSGFYPAFLLSAYKPAQVFKGGERSAGKSMKLFVRNGFVVFQFAISIILIIGTFIVHEQLDYIRTKNMGYDKEEILYVPMRGTWVKDNYQTFIEEILQSDGIINASGVSDVFGKVVEVRMFTGETETGPVSIHMSGIHVDQNFMNTLGLDVIEGRDFSQNVESDIPAAYIINEATARFFGWDDPVGKRFTGGGTLNEGRVVGVVRDFNFATLHTDIRPLAFSVRPGWFDYLAVKVSATQIPEAIEFLKTRWSTFVPGRPLEFFFLDENIDKQYRFEQTMGEVFSYFTGFAIFISCLGLFGMVSYTAEQRTKEIGIRKTLGASISQIVSLLSKNYLKLIIMANMAAWPIAYYSLNMWLQRFAFRVDINVMFFVYSALVTTLIALLTVSYQTIRSALANPVDSLKYE